MKISASRDQVSPSPGDTKNPWLRRLPKGCASQWPLAEAQGGLVMNHQKYSLDQHTWGSNSSKQWHIIHILLSALNIICVFVNIDI
jgi:hypothetical protein